MASKLVDRDEIGSIFSLISFFEALIPLFMAPTTTAIFNATLDIDSGIVFYFMAALNVAALPLCLYLDILWKKMPRLQE